MCRPIQSRQCHAWSHNVAKSAYRYYGDVILLLRRLSVRFLLALGPLAPVVAIFLFALALFLLSRSLLLAGYWDRLQAVEHLWWLFPLGLRMDVVTLCAIVLIPALTLLLLPNSVLQKARPWVAGLFSAVAAVLVYMEVATVPFVAQYDSRPNHLFIDYLAYPQEVFGTIWAGYKLEILVAVVLVTLTVRLMWRGLNWLMDNATPWSAKKRLLVWPLVLLLLVLGGRSSLGVRPVNISTAAFSSDHLANQLALNSTYSLGYALYRRGNETDGGSLYGRLSQQEIIQRVRAQSGIAPTAFVEGEVPTLHHQTVVKPRRRPYNLVILLEESLGAEYVGALGGLPLTPNIDALSKEGMLLTRLYSTGTRTVRGLESVSAGFLPTASRSVVTLDLSQRGFFTIAELLKRQGYSTEFIYGGNSDFDNMRAFFYGNGFQNVVDEQAFSHPTFHSTWGVSDEDLVQRANQEFVAHGDQPFFALMLSTSNHEPFDYPAGRIEPYEQPLNTVHNAMKYADYAIGEFFKLAKQEAYFKNTVFLVVADHNTRVYGADLVPINKFHIPGLIIGPDVKPQRFDKLASQIDLLPTLLDLMGLEADHPMVGHDLLAQAPDEPGHAIMQYGQTNAYEVGEHVVITQPYKPQLEFRYLDGRLVPAPLDPEMAKDALAHILFPYLLYKQQLYHLPPEA